MLRCSNVRPCVTVISSSVAQEVTRRVYQKTGGPLHSLRCFFPHFLFWIAWGTMIGSGCYAPPTPLPPVSLPPQVMLSVPGNDTISAAGTVVNRYAAITQDVAKGSTQLLVGTGGIQALAPVKKGDLLLLIQMQGAQIDTTSTMNYGTVVLPTQAGLYEFIWVDQVDIGTGTIFVDPSSGGFRNDYAAASKAQVVWVPKYTTLTVSGGASIRAMAWDGKQGGIVAIQAKEIQLDGAIDVSGMGFRGGATHVSASNLAADVASYVTADLTQGAEKGEGIAGSGIDYDGLLGRYGRGAPGNGGGGGNPYEAGGGGGANASIPGKLFTGQGVMTLMWQAGWLKEVAMRADSAGGGRGGYTDSTAALDPTMISPGDPTWNGNQRRERGGIGGHPVNSDVRKQLFLGGGGGAGDVEVAVPLIESGGGNGGGMILLVSKNIHGTGQIVANGQAGGGSSAANPNIGAGGGGAGGTILLSSSVVQGVQVKAEGAAGGSHVGTSTEATGPGGGGGGGLVVLPMSANPPSVLGGVGGHSQAMSMMTFLPNGATDGDVGNIVTFNQGSTDLLVLVNSDVVGVPLPDSDFSYRVRIINAGPDFVENAQVNGALTPLYPNVTWTCQTAGAQVASCATTAGDGNINTLVTLDPGTYVDFVMKVPVPSYENNDTLHLSVNVTPPADLQDLNAMNNQQTFVLQPPADVDITMGANTIFLDPQTPIEYTFFIKNLGPYCAYNLLTHIEIPSGATLQGLFAEGFSCTTFHEVIDCTLPQLCIGGEKTLRMSVLPPALSTMLVKALLSTSSFDPNSNNNNTMLQISVNDPNRNTLSGTGIHCQYDEQSDSLRSLFGSILFGCTYGGYIFLRRRTIQKGPRGESR